MSSRIIDKCAAGLAFLMGLFWVIVPCYWYYVDSIGYMNGFLEPRKYVYLWHIYHPLFPGPWLWIWTPEEVIKHPMESLYSGGIMISLAGSLGIWATYRWGRIIGLNIGTSLLAAAGLCGFGAWAYYSTQWAAFIPAISFMLFAFLILVGGYVGKTGITSDRRPGSLRSIAAGVVLAFATGIHGLVVLALPGFIIALGGEGRVKRRLYFLAGYFTMLFVIWFMGLMEYHHFSVGGSLSDWLATSYASEEKFWVEFQFLHILQASLMGNIRTLFIGYLWSSLQDDHFKTLDVPIWHNIIKVGGSIIVPAGFLIYAFALLRGWSSDIHEKGNKALALVKWGLISAWFPLAILSTLYAAYRPHFRLFAWALFWWLLLLLYSRAASGPRGRMCLLGLTLIVVGLWSHNYFAGPLLWGDSNRNPYLVESAMISNSYCNTSPVILESNFIGFERAMYIRLFTPCNFSDMVNRIKGRQPKYFLSALEHNRSFRITGAALDELGWQITESGELLAGDQGPIAGDVFLGNPKLLSNISTPLGDIYLLGWE